MTTTVDAITTPDDLKDMPLDDMLRRLGQVIGLFGIQSHPPADDGEHAGQWTYRVTFAIEGPFMRFECVGVPFPDLRRAVEYGLLGALAFRHEPPQLEGEAAR